MENRGHLDGSQIWKGLARQPVSWCATGDQMMADGFRFPTEELGELRIAEYLTGEQWANRN
jgi:hypothetical protein